MLDPFKKTVKTLAKRGPSNRLSHPYSCSHLWPNPSLFSLTTPFLLHSCLHQSNPAGEAIVYCATLIHGFAFPMQVRLAISHALAQATKLSVYEARVVDLVEETRHLPQALAAHGRIRLSSRKLAMLIGKVGWRGTSKVHLVCVLCTPDHAPPSCSAVYAASRTPQDACSCAKQRLGMTRRHASCVGIT